MFLSKIPIWIKAVLLGFVILEVTTRIWRFVAIANIQTTPELPWSFPVMLVALLLSWKYLSGSGPPASTQETRRIWIRANRVQDGQRVWAGISAVLLGIVIIQLIVIGTRMVSFESGQIRLIEQISVYPAVTTLSLIIMTSLVAGVAEEIAFRGYMQKPIEMSYGPRIGIVGVALFFTLLHLPNATITPHLIPLFFIGALGWGLLAYLTDSIVPGMIVHSMVDLTGYMWTWLNLDAAKSMATESVVQNGIDPSFALLIISTIVTVSALIVSFYTLSRLRPTSSVVSSEI